MRIATLFLLTILCSLLSVAAFATDFDNYDNGPTNGTSNAYFIDTFAVSDSFVPQFYDFGNFFMFAEWVQTGARPRTVDWAIGTSSFGSNVGSGFNAYIDATLLCSNGTEYNGGLCGGGLGYDVYTSTVFVGFYLTPGDTYWLTLTGATDSFDGRDGWDINSGPSQAFHNVFGAVPSESFTIVGVNEGAPKPSSIMLFGSGLLAIAGKVKRRWNLLMG